MRFRLAAVINSVAAHGHRGDLRIRSGTSVPRRTVERCPARYVGAATRGPCTSTIAPALIARCAPQGNASSTGARGRPGGGPSFPRASARIASQPTRQISRSSTPLTCTDTDGGPFGPCDPTGPEYVQGPSRLSGGVDGDLRADGDHGCMRNTCRCGHDRAAHQHYRTGSDCGSCEAGHCRGYRSDGPLNRVIEKLAVTRSH
ncbi:MAG: hypothetical protein QOF88_2261 [Mycobacterium sp.]|jgi:hypothetical protein|nr:hypothetical protein [Mycobacterium sp.]